MPATSAEPIKAIVLDGFTSYDAAFQLQLELHKKVRDGESPGFILFLQHSPVLTLGKNADNSLVLASKDQLLTEGVDLVSSDRGGEVTAHMPGQLVVYPILPIQRMRIAPRAYVESLQAAVINTLAEWDLRAETDETYPGVWIDAKKICAVGVRIRERVSMHGIALNCNNGLELFARIIPCGIRSRGITSMAEELGHEVDLLQVTKSLGKAMSEVFHLRLAWD